MWGIVAMKYTDGKLVRLIAARPRKQDTNLKILVKRFNVLIEIFVSHISLSYMRVFRFISN